MGVKDKRWWFLGACLWAFAEATAFFIVPDLLLTAAVLVFGLAVALRFAAAAAIAAAAGGWLMWNFGAGDADGARGFVLSVPLIGEDLISRVRDEIAGAWGPNLALGAVTGAPYKIYAVEAGAAGVNPLAFAVVSIAARFARFALTIGLAALGAEALRRLGRRRLAPVLLAGAWGLIYAGYVVARMSA